MNKLYPDNESLKKAHLNYPDVMKEGWKQWIRNSNLSDKFRYTLSQIPDNSILMDVGCNSGEMGLMFTEINNCKVYGIDISPSLVNLAKKKGINAVVGDAEKLPYDNDFFDCAYLGEMLEHSYNPEGILSEIKRVLKPGGLLVGTTINEEWLDKNTTWYDWEDERLHTRKYGVFSIRKLLKMFFDRIKTKNLITGNGGQAWIMFTGRKINA